MKIAIYHNLRSGGAKRSLCEGIKRLSLKHKMDVYTLSCAAQSFADLRPYVDHHKIFSFKPINQFAYPFARFNTVIRILDLFRLRALSREIGKIIEHEQYDLLFVQPCQFENSPSILKFVQKLPTIYYCHEHFRLLYEENPQRPYEEKNKSSKRKLINKLDPFPGLYYRILKNRDKSNISCAKKVLVNSEYIRATLRRIYGVNAEISYHGVDPMLFHPLGVDKDAYILSVGSLTPLKGFDFLIQALAKIPAGQRQTLIIASNFQYVPEKKYIINLARESGVNIKLLEDISDERLVELYNTTRLVVYSPLREPFGLVPLEAMACGAPLIAISEGGVGESVLNEKTGLLIDRDEALFAEAIQRLYSDTSLAREYGQNARQHVLKNWTWDMAIATLEKHLESVRE